MSLKDAVAKVDADRATKTPAKRSRGVSPPTAARGAAERPWDERMKRHTFHVSVDHLDEMRQVARDNDLSLTQLLHAALESHLGTYR